MLGYFKQIFIIWLLLIVDFLLLKTIKPVFLHFLFPSNAIKYYMDLLCLGVDVNEYHFPQLNWAKWNKIMWIIVYIYSLLLTVHLCLSICCSPFKLTQLRYLSLWVWKWKNISTLLSITLKVEESKWHYFGLDAPWQVIF